MSCSGSGGLSNALTVATGDKVLLRGYAHSGFASMLLRAGLLCCSPEESDLTLEFPCWLYFGGFDTDRALLGSGLGSDLGLDWLCSFLTDCFSL